MTTVASVFQGKMTPQTTDGLAGALDARQPEHWSSRGAVRGRLGSALPGGAPGFMTGGVRVWMGGAQH